MNRLRKVLHHHFHHPNYLYFLISLVLLIMVPPFAALSASGWLVFVIAFALVLFMGSLYVTKTFAELTCTLLLSITIFLFFLQNAREQSFHLGMTFCNLLLFGFFFIRLLAYLLRSKRVNTNNLYASIAGFLVLGLIGMPMVGTIAHYFPGAYTLPETFTFYDILYYSYITITTVGYGDIIPIHPVAKALAVLLSIAGQLYITFVVAIIIGKYLANDFDQNKANSA